MTQIVENWTDIEGIVESVAAADPDDVTLQVRVNTARPVRGFANLVEDDVGDVIAIRLRHAADTPSAGDVISCRVRKVAVDRFFADEQSLQIT